MKYEILEHTAELRFRVYGKILKELFFNAAEAMADTLAKSEERKWESGKKEKIEIQSIDIDSLLVDFLSEVLAKSQINKCVYLVSSIKCQASSVKTELTAQLIGYPVERFDEDIKAVTYQDLNIRKINKTWQTDLVFDI